MVKVEIELEDLTNLNHEKNRLNNEYEVLNDIYVTCLNTLKKRNDKLKILEEENETLKKQLEEKNQENQQLKEQLGQIPDENATVEIAKNCRCGREENCMNCEHRRNTQITNMYRCTIKGVVFRYPEEIYSCGKFSPKK